MRRSSKNGKRKDIGFGTDISPCCWSDRPDNAPDRTLQNIPRNWANKMTVYDLDKLMSEARHLAAEYRRATGKSLGGVSGEIAEFDAARLLDLDLIRDAGGYDAIGRGSREGKRIQIKGRAVFDESRSGQRIGQLKIDREWDSVMLVLMDQDFESFEIYEAEREDVLEAIEGSGNSRRTKRGLLSVAKFKIIGRLVWSASEGPIDDEIWDNKTTP